MMRCVAFPIGVVSVLAVGCAAPASEPGFPRGADTAASVAPIDGEPTVQDLVDEIDRTVDPDFVYAYDQARFVPPDGRVLLVMGQTVERIDEYVDRFDTEPAPGGWSAYWGIPEFNGITEPHVNDLGVTHHHQMLVDRFPNTVINSGLWMVGTWDVAKNTAAGAYDAVIDQYSAWAKTTGRPIYLRIGYEFDGPHNALEPEEYIAAYRHIVDRMRADGVDNVAFVWHSYAAPPYGGHPISAWYPGDDYVDWVGISVFFQPYIGPFLGQDGATVVHFARDHRKPVMIAEANPILGIDPVSLGSWEWFAHFFSMVYHYNIRAVCFINEDWTQIDFPGLETWQDARLVNNPTIADAWFLETQRERYLKPSTRMYERLGYTPSAAP